MDQVENSFLIGLSLPVENIKEKYDACDDLINDDNSSKDSDSDGHYGTYDDTHTERSILKMMKSNDKDLQLQMINEDEDDEEDDDDEEEKVVSKSKSKSSSSQLEVVRRGSLFSNRGIFGIDESSEATEEESESPLFRPFTGVLPPSISPIISQSKHVSANSNSSTSFSKKDDTVVSTTKNGAKVKGGVSKSSGGAYGGGVSVRDEKDTLGHFLFDAGLIRYKSEFIANDLDSVELLCDELKVDDAILQRVILLNSEERELFHQAVTNQRIKDKVKNIEDSDVQTQFRKLKSACFKFSSDDNNDEEEEEENCAKGKKEEKENKKNVQNTWLKERFEVDGPNQEVVVSPQQHDGRKKVIDSWIRNNNNNNRRNRNDNKDSSSRFDHPHPKFVKDSTASATSTFPPPQQTSSSSTTTLHGMINTRSTPLKQTTTNNARSSNPSSSSSSSLPLPLKTAQQPRSMVPINLARYDDTTPQRLPTSSSSSTGANRITTQSPSSRNRVTML